jgi:NTP pyrophosphatase (non-canonical NTP hydrolase)
VNSEYTKVIFATAIQKWGIESQMGMLQEECAEVIVAVNKLFRKGILNRECEKSLCEELADVEIMCLQMRELPGYAMQIDEQKARKIKRLHDLLEK